MKRPTIISGPPKSGKNWTALAIANQYKRKKVLHLLPCSVVERFSNIPTTLRLYKKYALLIIEECKRADIQNLYTKISATIHKGSQGAGLATHKIKCPLSLVFITQEDIYQDEFQDFHVINCNNRHLFRQ